MHPRTEELLSHLRDARAELARAVAAVPAERRREKPAADQWSVAEILEHLSIVEARIADMVARDVAAAKAAGIARETSQEPVLITVDVEGLKDRTIKRVAGETSQPTGSLGADDAWTKLADTRAALESALREGDGWALGTLFQPHHRLGPMNMYQWIGFAGAHELRHAAQIVEVGKRLTANG